MTPSQRLRHALGLLQTGMEELEDLAGELEQAEFESAKTEPGVFRGIDWGAGETLSTVNPGRSGLTYTRPVVRLSVGRLRGPGGVTVTWDQARALEPEPGK